LNLLDSGVRRNDEFLGFLTFCEIIKIETQNPLDRIFSIATIRVVNLSQFTKNLPIETPNLESEMNRREVSEDDYMRPQGGFIIPWECPFEIRDIKN
jgi:hypothetical protein